MSVTLVSTGVQFPDGTIQTSSTVAFPSGVITMWSGSNASIPSGWNLCNGSNGTPDLRNRFIVGSGSSYATGNTGGANSVTSAGSVNTSGLSTGTTTLSIAQMPSHNHGYTGSSGNGWPDGSGDSGGSYVRSSKILSKGGSAPHSHSMSGSASFSGSSTENRPLYYALAYIMKS
tara:strand:+ start:755 stop:1276 length:522 start_codon:yes stop_codon:yes gene_type:complete